MNATLCLTHLPDYISVLILSINLKVQHFQLRVLCLAHINPAFCQHTHTNTHTRMHTHTHTNTHKLTPFCVNTHTCKHARTHAHTHTHTHTNTHKLSLSLSLSLSHTHTHTHSHSTHTPLSPVCKPLFYLIANQMWDQKTQADLSACILMPGCGAVDSI